MDLFFKVKNLEAVVHVQVLTLLFFNIRSCILTSCIQVPDLWDCLI